MDLFAPPAETRHHYTLTGANSQVLSISLKNGESAHAEPGTMMMMSDKIESGVICKFILLNTAIASCHIT
jgi:uncharacterized protein (AIM24 family)